MRDLDGIGIDKTSKLIDIQLGGQASKHSHSHSREHNKLAGAISTTAQIYTFVRQDSRPESQVSSKQLDRQTYTQTDRQTHSHTDTRIDLY